MFNFFKKNQEPKNIKQVVNQLQEIEKDLEELSHELSTLKEKNRFSIQKVGVVRFNPFQETGGDQSFSVALLDENNSGIIITSLYGREGNRVFAKPIENNKPKYSLSREEKEAIRKAQRFSNKNDKNE